MDKENQPGMISTEKLRMEAMPMRGPIDNPRPDDKRPYGKGWLETRAIAWCGSCGKGQPIRKEFVYGVGQIVRYLNRLGWIHQPNYWGWLCPICKGERLEGKAKIVKVGTVGEDGIARDFEFDCKEMTCVAGEGTAGGYTLEELMLMAEVVSRGKT